MVAIMVVGCDRTIVVGGSDGKMVYVRNERNMVGVVMMVLWFWVMVGTWWLLMMGIWQ